MFARFGWILNFVWLLLFLILFRFSSLLNSENLQNANKWGSFIFSRIFFIIKNLKTTQNFREILIWNLSSKDGEWDWDAMGFVARDTNPGIWEWDWDCFSWGALDWDKYRWDSPGTEVSGTSKSQASLGQVGTLVPRDKNRWVSPGILSFGTQVRGKNILGTGSPVQCPSLLSSQNIKKWVHLGIRRRQARIYSFRLYKLHNIIQSKT